MLALAFSDRLCRFCFAVRSSLFQSETELLELLQRLRQLEFTVQAIMVSRDETAATLCFINYTLFVCSYVSIGHIGY